MESAINSDMHCSSSNNYLTEVEIHQASTAVVLLPLILMRLQGSSILLVDCT